MPALGAELEVVAWTLTCEACRRVVALEVMPDVPEAEAQAALLVAADALHWDTTAHACPRCRVAPAEPCEGVSARWCHNCGTCQCGEYDDGGEIGDNSRCPLHGDSSTHGDEAIA